MSMENGLLEQSNLGAVLDWLAARLPEGQAGQDIRLTVPLRTPGPVLVEFRPGGAVPEMVANPPAGALDLLAGGTRTGWLSLGSATPVQANWLAGLLPMLAPLVGFLAQRADLSALLGAYLGRDPGRQVVQGTLPRGESGTLTAAILFADLRGSTTLANTLGTGPFIRQLNSFFDRLVGAVEGQGGDVLKFMGDGLLAVFPEGEEARGTGKVCYRAVNYAAEAALGAIGEITRDPDLKDITRLGGVGIGLSYGVVAYGNVGGAQRLDFTVIGDEVNRAARLQALSPLEGSPMVMSRTFAAEVHQPVRAVGEFPLKGFAAPETVFIPAG